MMTMNRNLMTLKLLALEYKIEKNKNSRTCSKLLTMITRKCRQNFMPHHKCLKNPTITVKYKNGKMLEMLDTHITYHTAIIL